MLTITLQDLRYRARQFVIAVVGAGLVFAMTLLLAGLAAGFSVEINQTVQGMGADSWVLAAGAAGRIAGLSPLPITAVSAVARQAGVTRADPIIVAPHHARRTWFLARSAPTTSVRLITQVFSRVALKGL